MADDKKIIFSMVGVSKIYPPQKQVLKDIYLSFYYGAKIGILGLNGAGKSTLMKIIAGLEKSFTGEVVFSPGYCWISFSGARIRQRKNCSRNCHGRRSKSG